MQLWYVRASTSNAGSHMFAVRSNQTLKMVPIASSLVLSIEDRTRAISNEIFNPGHVYWCFTLSTLKNQIAV